MQALAFTKPDHVTNPIRNHKDALPCQVFSDAHSSLIGLAKKSCIQYDRLPSVDGCQFNLQDMIFDAVAKEHSEYGCPHAGLNRPHMGLVWAMVMGHLDGQFRQRPGELF